MPSLSNLVKQASRGADLYFVFRFLRLLTMDFKSTSAYKLGIIDEKGKALKKSNELTTVDEKAAYTMLHRLVFKIRGLLEKVPILGRSILLNYAAALYLLKEQHNPQIWNDDEYLEQTLMEFLQSDWETDAQLLKEELGRVRRMTFKELLHEQNDLEEETPTVSVAAVSGLGVKDPDVVLTYKKKKEDEKKAKKKRKEYMGEEVRVEKFAGKDVFIVDSDTFYRCRMGKRQYHRYDKYVGTSPVGEAIRQYGLKYPKRPIVIQNGDNGPMIYLRYGRS